MGQLEETMIQRVGFQHKGVGAQGLSRAAATRVVHVDELRAPRRAFSDQIQPVARGQAGDHDVHNRFYDEYLAVMDMTAEFYLSTVERVFKNREIARNEFVVNGHKVDIGKITTVAVKTVEGELTTTYPRPVNASPRLICAPACPTARKPVILNPAQATTEFSRARAGATTYAPSFLTS